MRGWYRDLPEEEWAKISESMKDHTHAERGRLLANLTEFEEDSTNSGPTESLAQFLSHRGWVLN